MCLLPAVWRKPTLLSFLYFHLLFSLSARETSSRNRSICKCTRERVDSKGLYGRWRLHRMGSRDTLKSWSTNRLVDYAYIIQHNFCDWFTCLIFRISAVRRWFCYVEEITCQNFVPKYLCFLKVLKVFFKLYSFSWMWRTCSCRM